MKTKNSVYSLNISNKFVSKTEAKRQMKNIYQMMKRKINEHNNNIRYSQISFIIGISDTESSSAKVDYITKPIKGRPQKIIIGTKIPWHIHIYLSNNSASLFPFYEDVKETLEKKGYNVSKNKNDSITNAIKYMEKQCISIWRYGDDFKSKKNSIENLYIPDSKHF